jgi:hypothetical protein
MPPNSKSVAGSGKWGNPYDWRKYGCEQAIEKYREGTLGKDLLSKRGKELARVGKDLSELRGKNLAINRATPMFCWSSRTNDIMRDERI